VNRAQELVLVADDDRDDCLLIHEALRTARPSSDVRFVATGEELLSYLLRRNQYAEVVKAPLPGLVLLDLNMPKLGGREALCAIRGHPTLRRLPVIVFSTSKAPPDVLCAYDLGASSFITKPATFDGLVNVLELLGRYWFDVAELPPIDSRELEP
jgi:CheY-like chemotaxis protein